MFSSAFDDFVNQPETAENIPAELPILPLRGTVAFPFVIIPLSIGVPRSVKLIKSAVQNDNLVGLVVSRKPEIEEPEPDELYDTGVVARIHRVVRGDGDNLHVIVQGIERFKIDEWTETEPFLKYLLL